ncbi:hypothetical protein O181_048588 [Austropuccinia psidii MF-1]|uniref:Uncharacterized protein n=1 Tax=Austropuccinia psidii MF-1 TaxID=1389203 RepID=A0A9Q3DYA1_9BASI|nr:hypothetical protein [Austropuccinia psidii MF-1]
MGQPKLTLYSLVIQKTNPLFKLHHAAVMLHTRHASSLSNPSNHAARGVPAQDSLARTPLWLTMMKVFPSGNGHRDPKQADGNDSGQLALDYPVNEGWRWQEDIQAWDDCHHVFSPMGFKCQKKNPPNPPQQDSPISRMPCEQTPPQPTPGLSGTHCSKDVSTKPSQHNEPPIPGLSPSSKPPEDVLTHEPEPEVAPTQSMEDPFAKSPLLFLYSYQLFLTPPLIISSLSRYSPLRNHHQQYACRIPLWVTPPLPVPLRTPPPPPPRCQAPLIPTMTLARNLPTLMIPQAIIHESINRILS